MSSPKSQTALTAHRCHKSQMSLYHRYYFLSTVDTADLFSSLCWSCGRWTPTPSPHSGGHNYSWMRLCLRCVLNLITDHSDETELQPKVRSSLDATWILIWTLHRSKALNSKVLSHKYPVASVHLKVAVLCKWSDLIFCYAIRILNFISWQTSCNIPYEAFWTVLLLISVV